MKKIFWLLMWVVIAIPSICRADLTLVDGEGIDLTKSGVGGNLTISGEDASTSNKGIASFNANDFDTSSGAISIDYTNGQAAATGAKGFLTSTDWNTFNGKLATNGNGSSLTGLTKAQVGLSNVTDVAQLPSSYLDTDGTLSANSDVKVPSQKAVKTYADTKQVALGFTAENAANKKTSLTDNSDTYYPSQKAVKTAVDAKLATTLADTNIFVGNGSNVATAVAMSGDATLANTGAVTVADDSHAHTSSTISGIDISADTNLAVGGTFLGLTGDTLAVKEGTLTNGRYCTYVTGTGLVCDSTGTGEMTYPGAGIAVSSGSAWGTSLTAPTGAIVGISDAQTLTNKTVTEPTLTLQDANGASPTTNGQIKYDRTAKNIQVGDGSSFTTYYPTGSIFNTSVADDSASGITFIGTAGENLVIGNVCYRKSDGKYWKAQGNSTTTTPVVTISTTSISADATGTFLAQGFLRDDSGYDLTVGGQLWLSNSTAGGLTQTQPTASGAQVQSLGYGYTADIIYFNPDSTVVELTS